MGIFVERGLPSNEHRADTRPCSVVSAPLHHPARTATRIILLLLPPPRSFVQTHVAHRIFVQTEPTSSAGNRSSYRPSCYPLRQHRPIPCLATHFVSSACIFSTPRKTRKEQVKQTYIALLPRHGGSSDHGSFACCGWHQQCSLRSSPRSATAANESGKD